MEKLLNQSELKTKQILERSLSVLERIVAEHPENQRAINAFASVRRRLERLTKLKR